MHCLDLPFRAYRPFRFRDCIPFFRASVIEEGFALYTLLIVNPTSGQGKAAREKRKLLDLVSNMPHIHARLTTHAGEACELASEAASRGFERVIVAGGDGTINQVINGLAESRPPARHHPSRHRQRARA